MSVASPNNGGAGGPAAGGSAQQSAHESNRLALEGLMTEFFSPTTSNERKAEIERMLNHFQEQKDSWKPSLEFLARTQNHYVAMFALGTIEVKYFDGLIKGIL